MVPASFTSYFIASVGASAALIGLLFVAVTVAPERIFGPEGTAARRAMAVSAFMALIDAFFVSLAALVPGANIGTAALVASLVALVNSLSLGRRILDEWHRTRAVAGATLVLGSFVVYGDEVRYAVSLLQHAHQTDAVYGLVYLLLAIYALGLVRAWGLLGGGGDGLLVLFGLRRESEAGAPAPVDASAGQPAPAAEGQPAPESP